MAHRSASVYLFTLSRLHLVSRKSAWTFVRLGECARNVSCVLCYTVPGTTIFWVRQQGGLF